MWLQNQRRIKRSEKQEGSVRTLTHFHYLPIFGIRYDASHISTLERAAHMDTPENLYSVAVIGTGVMGKGIVQIMAQSSQVAEVLWIGRSLASAEKSLGVLHEQWDRQVKKNRLDPSQARDYMGKVRAVGDYRSISTSKLVIEAVAESMEAKRDIFRNLSHIATPQMILASNTSSLSITELGSLCPFPENVVGLHFFNPAPVMKLTEIISGLSTSKETLDWAFDFSKSLGKEPVMVNEAPGFIVNRMLIPMINEAIGILAEGVATAEEIDKAMRYGANHPIGPLALADLIGNDVNLSIMETLHNETGDPKYRAHSLLRKMVRANHLGRKTGQGFYKY